MKIKNPFIAKHWSIGRVLFILWFIFATAFVLYTAWGALNNVIFRQGVQRGVQLGQNDAVTRVIQLSQNCNTVNLFAGEGENRIEIGLVNSMCSAADIKAAREVAQESVVAPTPSPVTVPVTTPVVENPQMIDPAMMLIEE